MSCSIPGMCSKSAKCADKHCEGHPRNRDPQAEYERGLSGIAVFFFLVLFFTLLAVASCNPVK